jgi:hypothetical protein
MEIKLTKSIPFMGIETGSAFWYDNSLHIKTDKVNTHHAGGHEDTYAVDLNSGKMQLLPSKTQVVPARAVVTAMD